ncbi:1,4-dihydroxy-2-naphthoate polyprenyltransferase [Aquibacillus sediminis]|uniref:1,4-dihydroxy-2-naphthoate polyprenyltransferase n=1 Tax=Aquibacillus sediminis TaxID=2574734 RepID=UPI001107F603|nr:1,4-dihydroxy-2-naphthoate polyprenyltransferase [Aquibacillus sediminis]
MQTLDNNVKSALNEKPGFHVWWRMLRPHTLTASFIPVFVGTMLATLDQAFSFLLFLAMLIASLLIQAATNMFNEYFDYVRGLDNENSIGIGGTIVRDGIKPKTVRNLANTFIGVAMLLGVFLCIQSNWWVMAVGLICILQGYLYSGGPRPIAYTPFGELSSGFFMGTVIIAISYFIQTGQLTGNVFLISIPVAIFIGLINLANNIRDHDGDKENGRKTIAILIGQKNAIHLLGIMFILNYLLTIIYIVIGILPLWSLITLLSLKMANNAYKGFKGKKYNYEMMSAMGFSAKTNTIFGFLLGLSLLIQLFIPITF